MKKKEVIRILLIDKKPHYNLFDAAKVLCYSNLEAAHQNVSPESVVCIEYGKSNANKDYYVDVKGLYALLKDSKRPSLVKIKEKDCDIKVPDSLKNNQAINGILYYPATLVLNIMETEHSEKDDSTSEPFEYLFSISEIAEEYGLTARKLNLYLEMKGIQHRKGNRWCVYKKYKKLVGYKRSENSHMYWTIDGMLFISSLLKADGYKKQGV